MTAEFSAKQPEGEESLRQIYGDAAVFTRVDRFTLVHLDNPSEETIAQRVREFDPGEFFFDDCPLCQMAMAEGGHVVFDGYDDEEDDEDPEETEHGVAGPAPSEEASPAGAFGRALERLGAEADVFGRCFDAAVPEALVRQYFEDVDDLPERLVEQLWAEESTRRVELFDSLVARAHRTVEELCGKAPQLRAPAAELRKALDELALVWRRL